MSERRQNQIRWALVILGFVITTFFFGAEGEVRMDEPDRKDWAIDANFPVPEPRPRSEGLAFLSRPFLFEMADTDKTKGVDRERRALDRYQEILDKLTSDRLPKVSVSTSLGLATVMVDGKPFVTALPEDCPEYYNRLEDADKRKLEVQVAYARAAVIENDLIFQTVKRHPVYLRFFNYIAVMLFFVVCAAELTVTWISKRLVKSPLWSLKLFLWVMYFTLLTVLHPSFDGVAYVLTRGAFNPIFDFILVGLAVAVLHQITHLAIHRYLEDLARFEKTESVRAALRRQTYEHAWTFVSKVTWSFLGLCVFLSSVGIDLGQFFAGAGLLGVAIGVMARDVFLDFFAGAYILAEDQFGVGDWIECCHESGQVIEFTLRSTKIRRSDGGLATVPNSDLRRVRNHSNEYSTVDFRVTVQHGTDTDLALALVTDEIARLETEWQEKLVGPAEVLGIQEINTSGRVLRVLVKTVPLAQREAHRRLNRLVSRRFDREGILLAGAASVANVKLTTEKSQTTDEVV